MTKTELIIENALQMRKDFGMELSKDCCEMFIANVLKSYDQNIIKNNTAAPTTIPTTTCACCGEVKILTHCDDCANDTGWNII